MNKRTGIICLLLICLTFVSYVYLHDDSPTHHEDNYFKTVIFKDKDNELIPVSIDFHSQVEREQEVMNRIHFMQSRDFVRYGLYPVLDERLEVLSVGVNDEVMTLNLNDNIKESFSLDVLEALTYILTDYDDVKSLKLQINGQDLQYIPNTQVPIPTLTQSFGLNNFIETTTLLHETIPVMAYHEKTIQQYSYYVPTTLRVNENDELLQQVKTILSHVKSEIQVVSVQLKDGILIIQLEPNILSDNETIDQSLQDLMVLSLSTIPGVKDIRIQINGEDIRIKKSSQILYNYIKI